MNSTKFAIILEWIPIISAPVSYILVMSGSGSDLVRRIISITMVLAFFGFVFAIIGRKLGREDRTVRVLGILDRLATVYVIVFYIIAIFSFGF